MRYTFILFIAFFFWTPINEGDNFNPCLSKYTADEILPAEHEGLIHDSSNQLYHRIPAELVHALGNQFYTSVKNQIKKNIILQFEERLSGHEEVLHYLIHSKVLLIKFQKKDIIFPFHFFW